MKTISINNAAQHIIRYIKSGNLKDITLRNLIHDSPLEINESFYSGLTWLIKENKIVFLITPMETYVLPVN